MLESLTLRRFQCHAKRTVEFSPTVTTLTGVSDRGKTAILRCLKWVCLNQPMGDAFIQHGEDSCVGTLKVDGRKIVRKRGKGINSYRLDDQTYRAFGQDVPPAIADLLNVSALNFQDQLSAPFWFALPAPQVSRELNAVVNLDVIDSTLANVAAEVRRAKAAADVSEERLQQAEDAIQRYENVQLVDKDLREIERLEARIAENRSSVAAVASLLREASEYEVELGRSSPSRTEAFQRGLAEIDALEASVREKKRECSILQQLIADIRGAEDAIREAGAECVKWEAEMRKRMGKRCPLCGGKVDVKSVGGPDE